MRKQNVKTTIEKEGEGGGQESNILEKDLIFLANYSKQGPKIAIFVPKAYHDRIREIKNPIKVTVQEALK